jgi:alanine racemase
MGRFGLAPEELLEVARRRNRWPNLFFEGLYTHMSAADSPDDPFNRKQIKKFRQVLRIVRDAGWEPELVHMANSAALVYLPETRFNLARPGIAIYGSLPASGATAAQPGLRPVMSFTSRLIQVRSFMPGDSFSYGHTFTAARKMLIGLVPVGYDNGFPRSLSNRAHVLVGGKRCPIVGNICMKALLVDVTDVADAHEGQEVVLLGRSGTEQIFVEDLAEKTSTISYELLCLLGKLNKRIILKGTSKN